MSIASVIRRGLGHSPSLLLLRGFTPAASPPQGGGFVTRGLGLSPSRLVMRGLAAGPAAVQFDITSAIEFPPMTGTLRVAGTFTFSAAPPPGPPSASFVSLRTLQMSVPRPRLRVGI